MKVINSMKSVPLNAVSWHGAISLEYASAGIQPWRIPVQQRDLFEPDLLPIAAEASGVRIAFTGETRELRLRTEPAPPHPAFPQWSFDLLVDGRFHQRVTHPRSTTQFDFTDIPAGSHRFELYLYQHAPVIVRSLETTGPVEPWPDSRPRWVVHGSSITHCGAAAGPSETWPALVARQFDLNLTNLGYGGQCHLDPMVARMIRNLPADYISLCFGINVAGAASLSLRTFRAAVIGFLLTIRDGHPDTPILVVSPLYNPPRETTPNAVGLTLPLIRQQIAEAVATLQVHGDRHLQYLDGLELFGPDMLHHLPDQLHPDAEGYRQLALRYARLAMPKLGLR